MLKSGRPDQPPQSPAPHWPEYASRRPPTARRACCPGNTSHQIHHPGGGTPGPRPVSLLNKLQFHILKSRQSSVGSLHLLVLQLPTVFPKVFQLESEGSMRSPMINKSYAQSVRNGIMESNFAFKIPSKSTSCSNVA